MSQDTYVAPSIRASSATFSTLKAGSLAGVVNAVVAANPPIANPTTQATVSVTGGGSSGGNLPAGAYFVSYAFNDGAGETTIGSSRSGSFTIAAGNIPRVTLPSLPTGASSVSLYLTAAGGAAGSESLYATGITTTTFDMSFAGPVQPGVYPNSANRSGASGPVLELINRGSINGTDLARVRLVDAVSQFTSGRPIGIQDIRRLVGQQNYVYAIHTQAAKEAATLIVGNPGTLSYQSNALMGQQVRTWS